MVCGFAIYLTVLGAAVCLSVYIFAIKSHFYFQIKLSPGLKKLFTVTAVSAISVIFLAHHFKRRRGKKNKKVPPWEPTHLVLECTKAAASEKGTSRNPQLGVSLLFSWRRKRRGMRGWVCITVVVKQTIFL